MIELSEIQENDFNLNIRRYADTSPPPEIFDVCAILHGGIPVREVENDYIQEAILKDFDVTTVFDKRDENYYSFKAEITNKESIRAFIEENTGDYTEAAVITQLEHWWNKYQVSLHQLDDQVASAEVEMKAYLKELGYE